MSPRPPATPPRRSAPPARLVLKPGRDRAVRGGHPWVFSGSVERLEGEAEPGAACSIADAAGEVIAYGYLNPRSQIIARVTGRDGPPGPGVWRARLEDAIAWRRRLGLLPPGGRLDDAGAAAEPDPTTACRLIDSEGDFLPGLIVDRYGPGVVVQLLTAGMERWRAEIVALLGERLRPVFIHERSDTPLRAEEGLPASAGPLAGEAPDPLLVREHGLDFAVDIVRGHKTGLYLDQRENRRLAGRLARGLRVLNCFAYAGGFAVHAGAGGAAASVSVDISRDACAAAEANLERSGLAGAAHEVVRADVFHYLRSDRERYGLIVLDPPKFARGDAEVAGAARGYQDINRLALARLETGGLLLTFSCSQAVSLLTFQQVVFAAAREQGCELQVLRRLGAAADHPFNACHREGEYLKGLLLRRVS